MNAKKTFSSVLVADVSAKLSSIGINAESRDVDMLDCAIEQIRLLKSSLKEELKSVAKAQKEAATSEAFEKGKEMCKSAKVGDIVTVICGSGKFAKEYNFPIVKIGDNTVTVEFTEDNTPNGTVGNRYINYAKVVKVA